MGAGHLKQGKLYLNNHSIILDRSAKTVNIYTMYVPEIALHKSVGVGDSLHNLHLVMEFCQQHLPEHVLHLTLNDLFHMHHDLKPNLLVFLAEIFNQFEAVKPECVTGDGVYLLLTKKCLH